MKSVPRYNSIVFVGARYSAVIAKQECYFVLEGNLLNQEICFKIQEQLWSAMAY